ncbi:MAG: hypothetical protein H8D78_16800 [Chloroflexi bacterium]|nr:hypothetical protein [Chloroflexota bacterium]
MRKRTFLSFALAMVVLISFSGCAVSPATPLEGGAVSPQAFTFRLPRMYVAYDDTGEPSVFGITASTLETMLTPFAGPNSLWMVKIHPYYMDWIKAANVQHIEAVWDKGGVFFFVNGKAMPYLAWDDESLAYAGLMTEMFGTAYYGNSAQLIRRLLPLLQRIGLDLVVQMPLADGATPIPHRAPKASLMEVSGVAEAMAEPTAAVNLEVVYDERGMPYLAGISAEAIEMLTGPNTLWMTKLAPAAVDSLQAANIQHVALTTQSNGLHILVNGQTLPFLAWDEEHFSNALSLYVQSNAPSEYVNMAQETVSQIGRADVRMVIHFPLAAGAEPIAAP